MAIEIILMPLPQIIFYQKFLREHHLSGGNELRISLINKFVVSEYEKEIE